MEKGLAFEPWPRVLAESHCTPHARILTATPPSTPYNPLPTPQPPLTCPPLCVPLSVLSCWCGVRRCCWPTPTHGPSHDSYDSHPCHSTQPVRPPTYTQRHKSAHHTHSPSPSSFSAPSLTPPPLSLPLQAPFPLPPASSRAPVVSCSCFCPLTLCPPR
jgi:hypothetical protein